MRSSPHILVVNGTKIRRPVFVLGAPHSGTDLLARVIKRSAGFHLTVGRPAVLVLPSYEALCLEAFLPGNGCIPESRCRACRRALALSPAERADFARALEDALWRAKRGE